MTIKEINKKIIEEDMKAKNHLSLILDAEKCDEICSYYKQANFVCEKRIVTDDKDKFEITIIW